MNIRLDKFLADMSVGTRTEVKKIIKAGRIQVNNKVVRDSSIKINTENDQVLFDNTPVLYIEYEYYMLNKPAGIITAVSDLKEPTVLNLISSVRKDLFPVGRLDRDTVGLLLIKNNGELAHRLRSPKIHVDKKYYVELDASLTQEMCQKLREGVSIEKNVITAPAKLEILDAPDCKRVVLTIQEGRFHQVKRMFLAVERKVVFLKRMEFGPLKLDENLKYGEYRRLNEKELKLLEEYIKDTDMEELCTRELCTREL